MRTLLAIVILAALGWSGFWWINASARDRAVTGWLADRREAGWVAEARDVRVTGFPSRVDTIVTGLDLADPDAGWSWKTDRFEVLSLTYTPTHFIAVLPGEQVVATPYATFRATSDQLRGSVIFKPTPRLELDHATFEIRDMQIASDQGWSAEIGKAIFATRQATDGPPFAHDVAFNADRLILPPELLDALNADTVLPDQIGPVVLDATLAFDRPWDRQAVEDGNPALQQVQIRDLSLTWGKLDLRVRGTLDVDARGFAEGRLDVRARNWHDMLDLAESAGALDPSLAGAVRGGLDLLARLSGDSKTLDVPLTFADGRARLGPIPLGPAPRLAARG